MPRSAQVSDGECLGCLLKLASTVEVGGEVGGGGGGMGKGGGGIGWERPGDRAEGVRRLPRRFGGYELLEELSRGGMGVVFRARELATNRQVALKLIRSAHLASEAEVKRFQMEAEAVASLDHPNIVPIHEVSLADGQHYFTMKYLSGGSLAEAMGTDGGGRGGGAGEWRRLVALMAKVARAVHHAHERGILHRDLKPSNILLDGAGEPYVSDFGLAKHLPSDAGLTVSDAVLGTAPFMSPEQAAGRMRAVTTASDIWSLGVILHWLLAGRLPFRGENALETLRMIQETEPPGVLAGGRGGGDAGGDEVPRDLGVICGKCLQKEPARRYASARALAEDLENWLAGRPIAARPCSAVERLGLWARREPLKAAVVVLGVLVVAGPVLVARGYMSRLPHMATQHPVMVPDHHGIYFLPLWHDYKDGRATDNFLATPFRNATGHWVRFELTNVPAEELASLRCVIRADQAGLPDPARSPVVTNGEAFWLQASSSLDRNFYVATVGWTASNLLQRAPEATARIVLVEAPRGTNAVSRDLGR